MRLGGVLGSGQKGLQMPSRGLMFDLGGPRESLKFTEQGRHKPSWHFR